MAGALDCRSCIREGGVNTGHVFVFELWPPDAATRPQYPILVPGRTRRITSDSPAHAREIAKSEAAAGWTVGAGSHIRAACTPPHPGTD